MFLGWPEQDRHMMIALARVERNTGRYGEWIPEATSERASLTYYGDDAIRYTVHGPYTNHVEKNVLDAQDAWKKAAGENANLNGMFWLAEPQ